MASGYALGSVGRVRSLELESWLLCGLCHLLAVGLQFINPW